MKSITPSILLISYDFPPIVSPRGIRCASLVRYFSKIGWNVKVLTISPSPFSPKFSEESLGNLPSEVETHRVSPGIAYRLKYRSPTYFTLHEPPAESPGIIRKCRYKVRDILKRLYLNSVDTFIIPGRPIGWTLPALREGRKILATHHIDVIVSFALPATSHLIAGMLKKHHKEVIWIGDTGDPWSFGPLISCFKSQINRKIERRLLKRMEYLVVTNDAVKTAYLRLFRNLDERKILVIPQGYSQRSIDRISASPRKKFTIVYTGIFYDDIRNPLPFFKALESFKDRQDLQVLIAGHVSYTYPLWIKEHNLDHIVTFKGEVDHDTALRLQKNATVVLNIGNMSSTQIPGKLYEYFGVRKPILHIRNTEQDLGAELIRTCNRGIVVDNTVEDIHKGVQTLLKNYKENNLATRHNLDPLPEFEWNTLWKKLEDAIAHALISTQS